MRNKKILITGASGFIGAHILRRVLDLGASPSLLLRDSSNTQRIDDLKNLQVYKVDIVNNDLVNSIFKEVKPEIIIHLASTGVYSYSDIDFSNTKNIIDSNMLGTINLIKAAKKFGAELFVNTGSCFEYGSKKSSFNEDDNLNPSNLYGITKVATTLYVKNFDSPGGLSTCTVRPFTVFGPSQDKRRFISTVIEQCKQGTNINIPKENIIRDYIYVDDVVEGYIAAIQNYHKLKRESVNISTGIGHSLEEVAKIIMNLMGTKKVRINKGSFPIREGEVLSLVGNPNKAKKLLNWEPMLALEKALLKTIDFHSAAQ